MMARRFLHISFAAGRRMVCEWCGVASASGNHATIQECVEALEREVATLKQVITQRERFLERMRDSKDPQERRRWKFKNS